MNSLPKRLLNSKTPNPPTKQPKGSTAATPSYADVEALEKAYTHEDILNRWEGGDSANSIGLDLGISYTTVYKILKKAKAAGTLVRKPKPQNHGVWRETWKLK